MALSLCLLDDSILVSTANMLLGPTLLARLGTVLSVHSFYSAVGQLRVLSLLGLLGRAVAACVIYPAFAAVFCSNVFAIYLLMWRAKWVEESFDTDDTSAPAVQAATGGQSSSTSWRRAFYRTMRKAKSHLAALHEVLMQTLFVGCHYGLFANMTKIRNEIIIEVSRDEKHWHSVELASKPGDPDLPPKVVRPLFHMPRVDWVFWFLAFRPVKDLLPKWFWLLVLSVMEGDNPEVMGLLHPTANAEAFARAAEARGQTVGTTKAQGSDTCPTSPLFRFVRIRLVNYSFTGRVLKNQVMPADEPLDPVSGDDSGEGTPDSPDSPASPFAAAARRAKKSGAAVASRQNGRYWSVLPIRTILPSTSLAGVYAILDTFDDSLQQRAAQRILPTAESAKDIILRTLFAGLKKKKTT
jgi:hypothetical protein